MALSRWKVICSGISQKWIFVMMAFFSVCLLNCIRVILSITITKMVPPPEEVERLSKDSCPSLAKPAYKNMTINNEVYEWDEYTQGLILSSYFWGYALGQFPCGYFSERFGGKHLIGFGTLFPSVLTLITPFLISWGSSTTLIFIRAVIGILNSTSLPACSTMIAQWTTAAERNKFGTIIIAASILGTMFGTTAPAVLMTHTGMGWPGGFYFFGIIGVVCFPLWTLMCYNRPEDHPFISEAELKYLKSEFSKETQKRMPPAPWGYIIKSKEFWAFVLALIGSDWAYYTITTDLPKYLNDVVKLSVESNGYISSLLYLCMWLNATLSSWIINKFVSNGWMSQTATRKLSVTIGIGFSSAFIVIASYAECNKVLVVVMLFIGITFLGSGFSTANTNNLNLSPNYAGSVMAVGNGIAASGGILTPYIIGSLTPNQSISEWRLVFWIIFGVSMFTTLNFLVCGSGEVQKWDNPNFFKNKSGKKITDDCVKQAS